MRFKPHVRAASSMIGSRVELALVSAEAIVQRGDIGAELLYRDSRAGGSTCFG